MGLEKRGLIKRGYKCDFNILDLNQFRAQATYTEPTRYATGLRYTLVNGNIVVKDDVVLNQSSGQLLSK